MQAEVAVGVEGALVLENADLVLADADDLTVAVLEFGRFSNELLGHERIPSNTFGWRSTLGGPCRAIS